MCVSHFEDTRGILGEYLVNSCVAMLEDLASQHIRPTRQFIAQFGIIFNQPKAIRCPGKR